MTALIEKTFLARTAEQHLAAAARWEAKEQAALKRGEHGQAWSFHLNKLASEARAQLAETGGWQEFPALFDRRGTMLRATAVGTPGQEDYRFIVFADDPTSPFDVDASFSPSIHPDPAQRRAQDAQSGAYVGSAKVQMLVLIRDHKLNNSVPNKGYIDVRRAFEVFDERAIVVDNGQ